MQLAGDRRQHRAKDEREAPPDEAGRDGDARAGTNEARDPAEYESDRARNLDICEWPGKRRPQTERHRGDQGRRPEQPALTSPQRDDERRVLRASPEADLRDPGGLPLDAQLATMRLRRDKE